MRPETTNLLDKLFDVDVSLIVNDDVCLNTLSIRLWAWASIAAGISVLWVLFAVSATCGASARNEYSFTFSRICSLWPWTSPTVCAVFCLSCDSAFAVPAADVNVGGDLISRCCGAKFLILKSWIFSIVSVSKDK